jgi:hypothetical protein
MKKKLHTDAIVNELKGASLFFQREDTPPPSQEEQQELENPRKRGNVDPHIRGNTETRIHGNTDPRKHGNAELDEGDRVAEPLGFDINQTPTSKYTLAFTMAELEALDDLKVNLRKIYGLKAPKIDIIRSALHHILKDYKANGETSIVVTRIREKKIGK